ncbi:cell wall-binding repeat-containing protein [Clostridium sp. DJ247]|uniref:cell wall-binding repeat-containing protein n=1 Tax=Clostridium sp. DJ247 TaxID=2726188 RepID=UPI0016292F68|nr:cell wall-binding repeat-containing protein [Clostridium sp. DJ247]MBC2581558.1 cell wall-binding repeat-containing protein [Clostridium sp. DJ247]
MLKKNKKFTALLLGVFLWTSIVSINSSKVLAASNRFWGQDRYETAAAISKQGWTTSDYVVVASGEGYADALCAAPLAKKYNAPILLTSSSKLNGKTVEEIKRLNAKHVFIIGKYASVSQQAENELKTIIGDIKRIGGNDRYETSVLVAKELGAIEKVAVTSGYGFADALSIAPIAAQDNMPILLTGKDQLPTAIQNYINENKASIKSSYIIGGEGVISNTAAQQLSSSSVRLSGKDRFETSLNIMKYFKDKLKFDSIYVVQGDGPTGNEFADALSGAALAVKTSSPVVLTYKTLSPAIESFIKENAKATANITALGGTAAVPDTLVSNLTQALSSKVINAPATPAAGGGGGSTSGGGSGSSSGGGSSIDTEELKSVLDKLNSVQATITNKNEKAVVSKIIDTINKVIANSNYDTKADADEVESMYDKLSLAEQNDLQIKILSKMSPSEALKLKAQFGL